LLTRLELCDLLFQRLATREGIGAQKDRGVGPEHVGVATLGGVQLDGEIVLLEQGRVRGDVAP